MTAVSRGIDRIEVTFDDPNLVANAGLLLVATLVVRLRLERLINSTLDLSGRVGGALPGRKVLTLVQAMVAGGSHIDHADLSRAGATQSVLPHRVMAPSTLGTFLRAFTFGHVRQLDSVLAETLRRAWVLGAGPGGNLLVADLDSTICEVCGKAKHGAGYGCANSLHLANRVHRVGFVGHRVEEVWLPSRAQDGEAKDESAVAELTSLIDDAKLPSGTRLIVRRDPLHPGAQRSLFPSLDFRYWGFYTDQDGDPRELDVTMRAHAHVEQHICRLKDSGLTRFPFASFCANANWLATVAVAADLVRWFQLLCFEGAWRDARPKALRWAVFHVPGRLVHRARQRVVSVIDSWPTTQVLLDAYRRIALLT